MAGAGREPQRKRLSFPLGLGNQVSTVTWENVVTLRVGAGVASEQCGSRPPKYLWGSKHLMPAEAWGPPALPKETVGWPMFPGQLLYSTPTIFFDKKQTTLR